MLYQLQAFYFCGIGSHSPLLKERTSHYFNRLNPAVNTDTITRNILNLDTSLI
ncbi:hypothetical protein [Floridanema aerugineum]|uniref:Uncharacterized protein n=1 Tax=Floridaenema aerugineum BLCC-F46 TaxID=3153654 RepID=A0ABV4WZ63_9CYAN